MVSIKLLWSILVPALNDLSTSPYPFATMGTWLQQQTKVQTRGPQTTYRSTTCSATPLVLNTSGYYQTIMKYPSASPEYRVQTIHVYSPRCNPVSPKHKWLVSNYYEVSLFQPWMTSQPLHIHSLQWVHGYNNKQKYRLGVHRLHTGPQPVVQPR